MGSISPRLIKQCTFNAGPPVYGKERGGDLGTKSIVANNKQLNLEYFLNARGKTFKLSL